MMHSMPTHDAIDLDLLLAIAAEPRASNAAIAERTRLSRNTVHARMKQLQATGAFLSFDRLINTGPVGYPLHAWIALQVRQRHLQRIVQELGDIPEVIQASGLAGPSDILVLVACRDADHLFAVDAEILDIRGVERTETSLSMGELIPFRLRPLIHRERARIREDIDRRQRVSHSSKPVPGARSQAAPTET